VTFTEHHILSLSLSLCREWVNMGWLGLGLLGESWR